jgi:putative ABC transport system permease protein
MALGATRSTVARAIFSNGLAMAVVGAVAGLIAARLGVRLVSHTLYGVGETDPMVFIGAPVALVAVATLACLIPVRRAVSVDPLTAIRAE